jgi:hypothetical protein
MSEDHHFVPFSDDELAHAIRGMRSDKRFTDVMPNPGELKIDWFLLHAMSREVARRRTKRSKLALLVSTVAREFVPDKTPGTRHLHEAYKCLLMFAFRRRKEFVLTLSGRVALSDTEYPEDAPRRLRLI